MDALDYTMAQLSALQADDVLAKALREAGNIKIKSKGFLEPIYAKAAKVQAAEDNKLIAQVAVTSIDA